MAFRVTLLILLLAVAAAAGAGAGSRRSQCLTCHGVHNAERGSCPSCHRGDDRSDRKEIAHRQLIPGSLAHFTLGNDTLVQDGTRLLDRFACRRCHWIGGKGSRRAANLDRLYATTPPVAIYRAITAPAVFMPDFHVAPQQGGALVNAIMSDGMTAGADRRELPQVVHFTDGKTREQVFSTSCGPCHKVLSEQYGGLGAGDVGPNLSGIFTEFYPRSYSDEHAWTKERLKTWLDNPRRIRPVTSMRPVRLDAGKMAELLHTLEQ